MKSNRTVGQFIPRHASSPNGKPPTSHAVVETASKTSKKTDESSKSKKAALESGKALSYIVPQVKVQRPKPPSTQFGKRVEKRVLSNGITLLLMHNPRYRIFRHIWAPQSRQIFFLSKQ